MKLNGFPVQDGIAYGTVFRYDEKPTTVVQTAIRSFEDEMISFDKAVMLTIEKLNEIKRLTNKDSNSNNLDILDAHIAMASDPAIRKAVAASIRKHGWNAAYAYDDAVQTFIDRFEQMPPSYLQDRVADLKDVRARVLKELVDPDRDSSRFPLDCIVVASDIPPSRLLQWDLSRIKGLVLEQGSATSHVAIVAKNEGIPTIIGVHDILSHVEDGEDLVLDGHTGDVILRPNDEELRMYWDRQQRLQAHRDDLATFATRPSQTADGRVVRIAANISNAADAAKAKMVGAEGIGLFRTEFMYMNQAQLPEFALQREAYETVLQTFSPQDVIIRTLDVGDDKQLPYLSEVSDARGIAWSLQHPTIVSTQFHALLAANRYGNLGIMIPMVRSVDEIIHIKKMLNETATEDTAMYRFGIMIETIEALSGLDKWIEEVDFCSVGTNDLAQELLGADRRTEHRSWYDPRLIHALHDILTVGRKQGKPIAVCGELASDPLMTPLLLGLGLKQWSVRVDSVLEIRRILSMLDYDKCEILAHECLKSNNENEIRTMLGKFVEGVTDTW